MLIAGFNLASLDYRRHRRNRLLLAAACGALIAGLAAQGILWTAQRRENRAVENRLAAMETEFRRVHGQAQTVQAKIPPDAVKQYEARVATYNKILEASTFSWIALLVELERAVPPGVTVASIQPDLASGKVTLRGEAQSFDRLTRLLTGLEQRAPFRDVFLLHQAKHKSATDGTEALAFSVSLVYEARPR
jgi:Tfp pilus assembly protein PilN